MTESRGARGLGSNRTKRRAVGVGAAVVLALGGLCVASPARAAGGDSAAISDAERLANVAFEQHAAGKYPEAIASYLKVYELSKSAVVLFNVATIYDRKLHERELAAEYFRRYLHAPDAEPELVQKANERLTTLKKESDAEEAKRAAIAVPVAPLTPVAAPLAAAAPAPAAATEPRAESASRGRPLRTAAIVVGAAGVLGLGASAVLGILAKGKNDDANAVCKGTECATDQGVTLARQAGTFATASTVSFVAGLALVGGGITLYLAAPKDTLYSAAQVKVGPALGLGQAGLQLNGSF